MKSLTIGTPHSVSCGW